MATSEAQKGYIYKQRERDRWRRDVSKLLATQTVATQTSGGKTT